MLVGEGFKRGVGSTRVAVVGVGFGRSFCDFYVGFRNDLIEGVGAAA